LALIDSGVGGLTLIQAIRHRYPFLDITYANDNANFPYGPRHADEVVQLVLQFVDRLHRSEVFDALVVGCNTASTVALPALRERLPVPVVGVVPAIKPAAAKSQTHRIALLATEGTISRPYTRELIANFANGCHVELLGSNELVLMAEKKLRGILPDRAALQRILTPLLGKSIDVIVLGCTHFPLLKCELQDTVGADCDLIDSGEAIAKRVGQVLGLDLLNAISSRGRLVACFSAQTTEVDSLRPYLATLDVSAVRFI
jgi:glutamate racemase